MNLIHGSLNKHNIKGEMNIMITLQYDCYDGGERKHFEDTFETKEEAELFLKQSSDEIWISLNSIKINGNPMDTRVVLHEQM